MMDPSKPRRASANKDEIMYHLKDPRCIQSKKRKENKFESSMNMLKVGEDYIMC